MSDSPESDIQTGKSALRLSVSPESDTYGAHVGAGEHVGQMLGSVRDCRQSLFGPSADRVHDHVEYSLTEVGESLRPIIDAMKTWGNHYRNEHEF